MWLLLLSACFPRLEIDDAGDTEPADADTDTDADSDTDTDFDTDSDTDAGTDADTDSDTDADVDEDCDNGRDDDGDGDADCDDRDCTSDPACDTCWDDDLGGDLGAAVASGSSATGNDGSSSCGGSSSADTLFAWTAPSTDTFTFDTVGSASDTVLWVKEEDCDGAELECNDDVFGTTSQLSVSLTRGDVVVVGVEANSGSWVLNAWQGDCPAYSIGDTLEVTGSTTSFTEDITASCEDVTNAITLRWIAPSSGTWTFSTDGSDFDTVLALFEESCDGAELDCNDDASSTEVGPSAVSVYLSAGDVVAVAVGGYGGDAGSYYLTISN